MLNGIRFVESYNAKRYLSGGATAQAATVLNGAVVAGATTIAIAANAGLVAGDFITIGALESAVAEQVVITAINASALTATISGIGNAQDNFGLRYAHSDGVAVTEADEVSCIVLQGPNSIGKAYSDKTGPNGRLVTSGPFDNLGLGNLAQNKFSLN